MNLRFAPIKVLLLIIPSLASACLLPGGPAPLPTPSPTVPPALIQPMLTWTRTGGIAGFCDGLVILTDATATLGTCQDPADGANVPIDEVAWTQFLEWYSALAPFSDIRDDGAVADSMTVVLTLDGLGQAEASEAEKQALAEFAGALFSQLTLGAPSGPCTLTANVDVPVHQRPDPAADLFGTLAAGEAVFPASVSSAGWWGFDPGVAQAANVGVFRLRWVSPGADVSVTGSCSLLPVAPDISPQACYTMAMTAVTVRSVPEAGGAVVAVLPVEGFAAVQGRTTSDWLLVDLNDSSVPVDASGWVSPMDVNFNGPCGDLPEIAP